MNRSALAWLVIPALFLLLITIPALLTPDPTAIAYSDFKALARAGQVQDLVLGSDTIQGRIAPTADRMAVQRRLGAETVARLDTRGGQFSTPRVEDPELIHDLDAANITYTGRPERRWLGLFLVWSLPALLILGLWLLLARRMANPANMMSVGKSKARVYHQEKTGVTFADVAGIDEARAELEEIVDILKHPERYRRLGARIPKGLLLVGAPGTGKTLLARAVAGEADAPFFSLSGSDFVEMFVGVGAARVRDLFAQALQKAPSIIFIDELDAVGKARGVSPLTGGHDEREQTLNQLLAELDGFDGQRAVMILGATNRPEILDTALLRPGRFDRQVVVDQPDLAGRETILRVHVRGVQVGPSVDLARLAAQTPGLVGADLANLVNEAALRAARLRREAVEMEDFEWALDRQVAGLERTSRVISAREKAIIAHHEAGHALVAESRRHADPVTKITIIPRGVASLGHTQQLPQEDRYLTTRAQLLDRLDVLLGGRVAEELVFGDVSTGAQDDLRRATDIARAMIAEFGMSERVGLATLAAGRTRSQFLRGADFEGPRYSEETASRVDREVRAVLDEAHARVRATLQTRRHDLERLAAVLIEREVITREVLLDVLGHQERLAA